MVEVVAALSLVDGKVGGLRGGHMDERVSR